MCMNLKSDWWGLYMRAIWFSENNAEGRVKAQVERSGTWILSWVEGEFKVPLCRF